MASQKAAFLFFLFVFVRSYEKLVSLIPDGDIFFFTLERFNLLVFFFFFFLRETQFLASVKSPRTIRKYARPIDLFPRIFQDYESPRSKSLGIFTA